ncbi:hypothetical protein ABFU60_05145 [Xanthomonas campestris pv. raphani]
MEQDQNCRAARHHVSCAALQAQEIGDGVRGGQRRISSMQSCLTLLANSGIPKSQEVLIPYLINSVESRSKNRQSHKPFALLACL